jgi:hypothetical protein
MPFGAVMAVAGLGMSAAGAAGAFSGPVDNWGPTPEEIKASEVNRQAYEQGRFWQQQLDPVVNRRLKDDLTDLKQTNQRTDELEQELSGLNADANYQGAGDRAVNQAWQGYPEEAQGVMQTATQSGGPGSGAFVSRMGGLTLGMRATTRGANAQGRLGYLGEYGRRRGQKGQVLGKQVQRVGNYRDQTLSRFGDYQERLGTGLNLVTGGGQNAASNQAARISAQVQDNVAANAAAGQIGGSMMGLGMGMYGQMNK